MSDELRQLLKISDDPYDELVRMEKLHLISLQPRKIVYVACPYVSSPEFAFEEVTKFAGYLLRRNYIPFSPITHCHPIHQRNSLPNDFTFWREIDFAFLDVCHTIFVLCLPGWSESVGVQMEVNYAKEHGIKVIYIRSDDVGKLHYMRVTRETAKDATIVGAPIDTMISYLKGKGINTEGLTFNVNPEHFEDLTPPPPSGVNPSRIVKRESK